MVERCQTDRASAEILPPLITDFSKAAVQFTSSVCLSLSVSEEKWTLIGAGWDLDYTRANSFLIQTELLQGVMEEKRLHNWGEKLTDRSRWVMEWKLNPVCHNLFAKWLCHPARLTWCFYCGGNFSRAFVFPHKWSLVHDKWEKRHSIYFHKQFILTDEFK